jgi:PAS domain S-box-containing protein
MKKGNISELRRQAQERLVGQEHQIEILKRVDLITLAQELAVHQAELEIQNEELRQARSVAEEVRDRYLELYDFAPVGYFTLDERSRIVEVNLAGCRLLEVDRRNLKNKPFPKFIMSDEADNFYFHCKEVLEKDTKQTFDLKMQKADGTPFYAQVDSVKAGQAKLRVSVNDITERKKAEEALAKSRDEVEIKVKERTADLVEANRTLILETAERKRTEKSLRESERRYRTLVENIPQAIFLKDRDLVYISCNEKYAQDLKMKPEEITGKTDYEFYPRQLAKKYRADDRRIIKTGKANNFEEKYVQDGQERIDQIDRTPVRDEKGNVVGVLGISQDITERKKIEEELQKIDKLESIGILAGGIAHDFNNLLTGIMGNIGLALRHMDSQGKAFERLVEAEEAGARAKDLTQQLLTFSMGGEPVKRAASIARLVKESTGFALSGSNIKCNFDIPANLWSVEVDEVQMNQVITNIVINAQEAMLKGGVINISAKNIVVQDKDILPPGSGRYVEIIIADHGVGIKKIYLDKIFDPYFTTKHKGSGLGLATCYSIIKRHGGYITVDSVLGVGTTFHVYLPASTKRIP